MSQTSPGCPDQCATCGAAGTPSRACPQNGWAARAFDPEAYNQHRSKGSALYIGLKQGDWVYVDTCENGWAHGWTASCGPGWFPHRLVQTRVPAALAPERTGHDACLTCVTCAALGKPEPATVQNGWAGCNFDPEPYNQGSAHQPCPESAAQYIALATGSAVIVDTCDRGWAHGWVEGCGPGWFPHGFFQVRRPCATCAASGKPGVDTVQSGWASSNFDPEPYTAEYAVQLCPEGAAQYVALTKGQPVMVDLCDGGWARGCVESCGPGWFPHGFVQMSQPPAVKDLTPTASTQPQRAHHQQGDGEVALAWC